MLAILRPHSEQKLIRRQIISSNSWIHQKFQMKSKILAEFQLLAVIFVDGIVPGNGVEVGYLENVDNIARNKNVIPARRLQSVLTESSIDLVCIILYVV